MRSALVALAFLIAAPGAAEPPGATDHHANAVAPSAAVCTAASRAMPVGVRLDSAFVPRLHEMLERSPTFRAQCRRLADAPWVHVAVRLDLSDRPPVVKAWSVIKRPQRHLLVAIVNIQPNADPAVWLAHELEHIIEQIDEVDVRGLASRRDQAWSVTRGMFETSRAVRAGHAVLREVRADRQEELAVD